MTSGEPFHAPAAWNIQKPARKTMLRNTPQKALAHPNSNFTSLLFLLRDFDDVWLEVV